MELRLCESDFRFMEVVWENAPVRSGELVKLCADGKSRLPIRSYGKCVRRDL